MLDGIDSPLHLISSLIVNQLFCAALNQLYVKETNVDN
jgi:hypothetical protein